MREKTAKFQKSIYNIAFHCWKAFQKYLFALESLTLKVYIEDLYLIARTGREMTQEKFVWKWIKLSSPLR